MTNFIHLWLFQTKIFNAQKLKARHNNQMVPQCWDYIGVIERLKINDIVFCLSVFKIEWHEGLWTCVYKGVEVKMMNGNAKSFL